MKFRTDFVTNSSDSSFLAFNIKNKKLYDYLTNLGIQFQETEDGTFSHPIKVILPSGESAEINGNIDGCDDLSLPYLSDYSSISAWLVAMILWEVGDDRILPKEYSVFGKDFIKLLHDANIIHLDRDDEDKWSRDEILYDLSSVFNAMDGEIEEAFIEHVYLSECMVNPCIYTEVHSGQKMSIEYNSYEEMETEDCDGVKFVITGKLKVFENREEIVEYIKDLGGVVSENVSKDTDYLICNDIHTNSSKMKKAKELGVPVLTEIGFIRNFGDTSLLDDIIDESEVEEDAWELTYKGGVLDFVLKGGVSPIVMEVWKDGRWIRN